LRRSNFCTLAFLFASATTYLQAADTSKSLYERLGGMPALQAVTSNFVDRILADGRVNKWFAHAAATPENAQHYKASLATFLCQSLGGPCKYTGPDMLTAHTGRHVTGEAFDAVVQDLVATLDAFKVPEREKTDLLKILGPLRSVIVNR